MLNCAYCGGMILKDDRRCPQCGSTSYIEREDPETARPAQAVAAPVEPQPRVIYVQVPQPVPTPVPTPVVTRVPARPVQSVSRKSRSVAAVWCVLFGWLGFHRFYVGKTGSGLLYLFTCGGFGIGIIVDLLSLLFGNFRDRDGLPLA